MQCAESMYDDDDALVWNNNDKVWQIIISQSIYLFIELNSTHDSSVTFSHHSLMKFGNINVISISNTKQDENQLKYGNAFFIFHKYPFLTYK